MLYTKKIILAALLATTSIAAPALAQEQPQAKVVGQTLTQSTTKTIKPLSINNKTQEVKPAVQHFVELINNARVDLAMKEPQKALPKLDEAQTLAKFIKNNSSVEEITRETKLTSGKIAYSNETTSGSYYVPFETGPVKLKEVTETPSDKAKNVGLAVSSTEVVYLTVDMSGDEADTFISQAKMALEQGDIKAADKSLADMMEKTVIAENADTLPLDKARDNLELALKFLSDEENYEAARYALGHSIDAYKEMSTDDRYNKKLAAEEADNIKQIHDLLLQENTAAAQKARTQIKSAQGDLAKLSAK